MGFRDLDDRYERLSAVGDPLAKLNGIIPWAALLSATNLREKKWVIGRTC